MQNTQLETQSTEHLTKSINILKGIVGALIVIIIILFSISIYGLTMGENKTIYIALIALGVSCSVILSVQFILMKKIKTELRSRKSDNW